MTDLREKVEAVKAQAEVQLASGSDPKFVVAWVADAIMALVQPVNGNLHQTLKSALMDYADALWNGGDPDPDAAAEALARRVQPVVTDPEIIARAIHEARCNGAQNCVDFDMLDGCEDAEYLDALRKDAEAALSALGKSNDAG